MIKINIDELSKKYINILMQRGVPIGLFITMILLGVIVIPISIYGAIYEDIRIFLILPFYLLIISLMYYKYNIDMTLQRSKINPISKTYSNLDRYILAEYWKNHIEKFNLFFKAIGFPIDFIKHVPLGKKILSSFFYFFAILLYLGAVSSIVLQHEFLDSSDKLIYIIIYSLYFILWILVATLLRNLARNIIRISVNQQKEKDKRKPIVYLRAFEQDKFFLSKNIFSKIILYLQGRTKLDPIMLEECSTIGPVIALGNPKKKKAPYGPPRYYAKDEEWRDYVHGILRDARYIYMFLQNTDGVKWEVEQLIKMNKLQKSIFIVAPESKSENILKYFDIIIKSSSVILEKEKIEEIKSKIVKKEIIGFFLTNEGKLIIFEGVERSWTAYFLVIRASLRLKVAFDGNSFSKSEIEELLV